MEDKIKIIPLKVLKTKKNTSMLQYAVAVDDNDYSRGVDVLMCWYEDERAFKIPKELILKPVEAVYDWKKSYNGTATMYITSVFDEKGEVIFGG